jgi:hypothetical protein
MGDPAPTPAIEMTVYGEGAADDANVPFPYELSKSGAAAIWRLADAVGAARSSMIDGHGAATVDWEGPEKADFDAKVSSFVESCNSCEAALRHLADGIGAAWAAARGQQDRINTARWFQHEEQNQSILEDIGDFFSQDKAPDPPRNPSAATAPDFSPTREPVHPEFENR